MNPEPAALQTVRAYHQRSKHRFEAYAPGPGTLDWDAQPAPFRHFSGTPHIALPSLGQAAQHPQIAAALRRPLSALTAPTPPLVPSLETLSVLLQLALGITAWKSYGPDRWAVRANPSSGNLHPVEGYLFLRGIPGLFDGLYHYCPDNHALECRAEFEASPGSPQVLIGLSSIMWREAWKYGERGFRYCQLDTGHAVGALRYAAALLGWPLTEQPQVATATLEQWLGLDRSEDFPAGRYPETEREEAEILLAMEPGGAAWLERACSSACWYGTASTIDRHPMYQWPVIEEVAAASRHGVAAQEASPSTPAADAVAAPAADITAATVILRRRSAQRFDARHVMPQQDFYALLDATLPRGQAPWDVLSAPARIGLVLLVHRVQGLEPGLYLLPRSPQVAALLSESLDQRFLRQPVAGAPPHLALQLLAPAAPAELHRVARSLHCHQDIAANACLALGMLADFDAATERDPSAYRTLYREAGLIGQALYLQAEALDLSGTGIGCYFDDPFHDLLGLHGTRLQSLYHFTVGLALEDARIETKITYDPELTS